MKKTGNFQNKKNFEKDNSRVKELKHKSRRRSISEGIFDNIKFSLGDSYISPFAIAINSSNSVVVLLSSISGLLGPLSQTFNSRLIEKYSRKKIVLKAVLFEILIWIPMIAIAFLFYYGLLTNILPLMLLIFFSLYVIASNSAIPAWFSWMGDVVDKEYRGRWFAKRSLILGFIGVIFTILAAYALDFFKHQNKIMLGFVILFSTAFIARIASWRMLKKQYEPKLKLKKGYYFSFSNFILNSWKNNFGKFALFRAFLSLAMYISSPLMIIYLLKELNFDYVTYMIIILSGMVFSLIVMGIWGKISDNYGNRIVFTITSLLISITPILFILSPNPIYLILIPSLISGIAMAGFNLAAANFVYDSIPQEKRGLTVSYYNLLNGIGIFIGAGIAAILIKYLEISFMKPLFFIFILSAAARIIVISVFLKKIKEVRKTKKFVGSKILRGIIFKDGKATIIEEAHEIMSIKKYLFER